MMLSFSTQLTNRLFMKLKEHYVIQNEATLHHDRTLFGLIYTLVVNGCVYGFFLKAFNKSP